MKIKTAPNLKIHRLTKAQYERELAAGRIDEAALYLTPKMDIEGGEFTGGVSTNTYKGEDINATPQFRNAIILTSEPDSNTISKLAIGDMVFIVEEV